MDYSFEACTKNCLIESIKAPYSETLEQRILKFAEAWSNAKNGEEHHKEDNRQEIKRFSTGILGEAAVQTLLQTKIIDWSLGASSKYHVPDIPGYNVGIKTVEYGKFPIIFKKSYHPEIICILDRQKRIVYICGLATTEVLNKYQSDSLVLSPYLKARGTKTGFYGFEYLKKITSIDDLKMYKK